MQQLNKIGISRIIARQAEKLAFYASALGIVTVGGTADKDFLTGGRLVQRVWLEAPRLGLSFQQMTGITFLMQRITEGEVDDLSPEHVSLIEKARNEMTAAFALAGETVVMMFRIANRQ
jgi:hypothetical protein